MGKIIIHNRTDLKDQEVLPLISKVIQMGRISNDGKQYCYLTTFKIDGEEYHVVTDLRKRSDVFTFYKVPK